MATATQTKGLRMGRYFTQPEQSPYDAFRYARRTSVIRNPTGETVFEMTDVEVPEGWSQVATDILAQKYFRKAGVPQPDGTTGGETSVKQVVHRLADCWRQWGERHGYFATPDDAQTFYDELVYMLLDQRAAPNSPQWFNTGLFTAYGIAGPAQGHWYVDPETEQLTASESAYERPQPHACFILSVEDDLVNPGGIMDLWVREARIFKYGSGVGTNYSNLRAAGEPLSGGGQSSGLMSFLKIGDRAAGAIKSGGTTRRAAKMVVLDADHPEVLDFIRWKVDEERKVAALVAAGYSNDYEGEAYRTVSGQNANHSVRLPDAFFDALDQGQDWVTTARTTGAPMHRYPAQQLWDEMAQAAWACADPGLQFDSTINAWHTCPAGGRIRASNPCSEYLFLDDTACNLASINLLKFYDPQTQTFDLEGYRHAIRLWTVVLEIAVLMAHFPSQAIAERSYQYRTLGLGYANLGALLMVMGLPYDGDEGRAICGALTAILTGEGYATSAELAEHLGPFPAYAPNAEAMLRVIRNHRRAAHAEAGYEELNVLPVPLDPQRTPNDLLQAARQAWDRALALGQAHGYRNAQLSVLAPTGTIGLLMDCDTTGVEPDFALVKFKKLSGGGYFKIVNQAVEPALRTLGYSQEQIDDIRAYLIGHGKLAGAPHLNPDALKAKGLNDDDLAALEAQLPGAFHLDQAFNAYTLGADGLARLGLDPQAAQQPGFSLASALGLTPQQVEEANTYLCGTQTVEGAPHLDPAHYPVFDCANLCGPLGTRFIHAHGHIRMMAAAQPFISGAISKTINFPHRTSWEAVREAHHLAWRLGLKALAIYRDGSKLSQPLSSGSATGSADDADLVDGLGHAPAELLAEVKRILADGSDDDFRRALRRMVNRRPLPAKRQGFTIKAKVGGQTVFLRTGEYPDGTLGEIFIDMHREGATLRSLLNCFAISISIGLQYGVPLAEFVDKFVYTRFDPAGPVDHPNIRRATSLLDYVFRVLGFEYLNREDLVHVKPNPDELWDEAEADASEDADTSLTRAFRLGPDATATVTRTPANGHPATKPAATPQAEDRSAYGDDPLAYIAQGDSIRDAPPCEVCGHITVRNGACYRCLNCGHSMGCS